MGDENATITTTPVNPKASRRFKNFILKISHDKQMYTISAENFCKIYTVKLMIKDKVGIAERVQELYHNNRKLEDTETLAEINEQSSRVLILSLTVKGIVEIIIVTPNISLNCKINKLLGIKELQTALSEKIEVPVEYQYLIYKGEIMDASKSLVDYDIKDGSTIEVLRRVLKC